jgi:hypothetical protein
MKVEFINNNHVLQLSCTTSELRLLRRLFAANMRIPQLLVKEKDITSGDYDTLVKLMDTVHEHIACELSD